MDSLLVGLSRKRTSSDGFALEIRSVFPSQLVWNAQVTARGRRMLGSCCALPVYTIMISRESRVPHRAAEGRLQDTSLWLEKRTVHELFRLVHDDLLTTNSEEGPVLHCAGTSYHCGKRENCETVERTIRLDSAGGVPTAAHREWSATSGTGESHKDDSGVPSKAPKHADPGTGP